MLVVVILNAFVLLFNLPAPQPVSLPTATRLLACRPSSNNSMRRHQWLFSNFCSIGMVRRLVWRA